MRASETLSSAWDIIRENERGDAIIRIDNLYYVVNVDGRNYQFRSALPADGAAWCANLTESGLRYVTSGRNRAAAFAQWRRHIQPMDENF